MKEYFDEVFYHSLDENETCQSTLKSLRIPSTQEKLGNNLHKKQKESKDMKVLNQSNDSSTVPPPWFKEYMETVSTINMRICVQMKIFIRIFIYNTMY